MSFRKQKLKLKLNNMDKEPTWPDIFFGALLWILFFKILFKVFQFLVKNIRKLLHVNSYMEEEKIEEYRIQRDQLQKENDQLREIISNQSETINNYSKYIAGMKKQI